MTERRHQEVPGPAAEALAWAASALRFEAWLASFEDDGRHGRHDGGRGPTVDVPPAYEG